MVGYEAFDGAERTGFASFDAPGGCGLVSVTILSSFISDRFNSDIHMRRSDFKQHGVRFVAVVQVLHVFVEKLKHGRALSVVVSVLLDERRILVTERNTQLGR